MGRRNPNTSQGKARVSALHQQRAKAREKDTKVATSQADAQSDTPEQMALVPRDQGLYRAMRTHLVDFKGAPSEPTDIEQVRQEIRNNIQLLRTCTQEVRESIVIDACYRHPRTRALMEWSKQERRREYRLIMDTLFQMIMRNMDRNLKSHGKEADSDRLRGTFEKLVNEYDRLTVGRNAGSTSSGRL